MLIFIFILLTLFSASDGRATAKVATAGQNINLCWNRDGNYVAVGNKQDVISVIDLRKMSAHGSNAVVAKKKFLYEVRNIILYWQRK